MLAIATYATKSYLFAWRQFLTRISAAASYKTDVHFILATDKSKESKEAFELARSIFPEGWKMTCINIDIDDTKKEKYKEQSQLLIASLQSAAFNFAKKIRANMLWSVESDTLVPPDALRMSEWVLNMPDAHGNPYYDVAACTYYNGLFLGGHGSINRQINEDFLYTERKLPKKLKNLIEICESRLNPSIKNSKKNKNSEEFDKQKLEKERKRFVRLMEKTKKYPPDGNIWEVIAKYGWRKRGWMDFAYPGIGKGSIVPSDWCGFGCTLMSEKALLLTNFDGYEGRGTQDLFVCWSKWYPADIKIACIPHSPCDHVKKIRDDEDKIDNKKENLENNKYIHHIAYHEAEGEFKDHLRVKSQPWIPI